MYENVTNEPKEDLQGGGDFLRNNQTVEMIREGKEKV